MSQAIRLTRGYETIVDDEDVLFACEHEWYAHVSKKWDVVYAARTCKKKIILLHKLIVQRMALSIPDNHEIDHRDRNGLNNQRYNLRIISHSHNMFNRNMQINNTSGTTGVTFYRRTGKWKVEIVINRKNIHLGYYEKYEDAVAARTKAELKYFGELKEKI